MRSILLVLCLSGRALASPAEAWLDAARGQPVILKLDTGEEISGRLVSVGPQLLWLERERPPFADAVPVARAAVLDVRLSLVAPLPLSPFALRDRGRRRQKRAGLGLMIAGAASLLVVPLLWAVAVPVSNSATQAYANSDTPFAMGAMGGYGSIAFGMVGGQLLTIGAILYKDARDDERSVASGLSARF